MTELAHTDAKPQEIVAAMRTRPSAARNVETALPQRRGIVFLFLAFFGAIVVKNLWITDDAYITFRTVDNFLHGYGLTWNTSERVQSYTHPLWMLLLAATNFIIRDIYFAALALCIVCTLGAAAILAFRISGSRELAILGLLALTTSRSFVDFSTSGLENPLTHLLLAAFALVYLRHEQAAATFVTYQLTPWQKRLRDSLRAALGRAHWLARVDDEQRYLFVLTLLAGLATFNRIDTVLFYVPALAFAYYRQLSKCGLNVRGVLSAARMLLIGFSPFIAWELFATWYYGFPFPNTAYAKLDTGISTADYLVNGLHYLWDSFRSYDPVLVFIPLGFVLPLFFPGRRAIPLVLGGCLYLVYVVKIGGDFMAGRYLTAELLLALILLSRLPAPRVRSLGGLALILALAGCAVAGFEVTNATVYALHVKMGETRYYHVIGDERSVWGFATDIRNIGVNTIPHVREADWGRQARASHQTFIEGTAIGFLGYEAGPHVYVFDAYALNDPLRARLPAASDWRIGHVVRDIPAGYMETLKDGGSHIQDPDLAHYYDKLSLITRGNLFDFNRLVTIFKMNLGQYDYLLQAYDRRHPASGTAGGAPPIWAAVPTSGYLDDRQPWPFEGIGY
jgi:arabinofuranosyltransferase